MKTIQVSDEMYNELMNISKELNTQNHRATRMPYIFQVRQKEKINAGEGYEDGYLLLNEKYENAYNTGDFDKLLNEIDSLELHIPKEVLDKKEYGDLEDYLIEEHGFYRWYYQEIETFKNAFFTNKGIKEHIEINKYNYENNVDTYLSYLERNSEMEIIMKFLCELSGGKLHR